MSIIYRQGSLFSAPPGSYLVHACNAQGVWGSGIAAQFLRKFPESYKFYARACRTNQVGNCIVCPGKVNKDTYLTTYDRYNVVCLVTSSGFGASLDSESQILSNTKLALQVFMNNKRDDLPIHSCKFNAGLFNVPWDKTEQLIEQAIKPYNLTWTVWEI